MYKLVSILALSLLATACVSHDPDEQVYDTEQTVGEWQRVEESVQQPAESQPVITRPVQVQTVEVRAPKQQWWATRPVSARPAPKCPCADPNDPCTQCYEK